MITRRLGIGLLLLAIAGCGTGANGQAGGTSSSAITTWAKHLEAGEYEQAKAMMINPSADWQESTQRSLGEKTWTNHKQLDIPAGEQTAALQGFKRVQWQIQGEDRERFKYLCIDAGDQDGKITAMDRPKFCTAAGSYDTTP